MGTADASAAASLPCHAVPSILCAVCAAPCLHLQVQHVEAGDAIGAHVPARAAHALVAAAARQGKMDRHVCPIAHQNRQILLS